MADYFTSDQHFNSDRTLKYSRRPFKSVAEMNHAMISAINELPRDSILYSLGDFGDLAYISAIRQDIKVRLVMGNWDYDAQQRSGMELDEWVAYWIEQGFDAIYPEAMIYESETCPIYCCHKPSERNPDMFNAFGHIHRAALCKKNGLNVGVDQHRYKPISFDDVMFWKDAIENHFDDEEWMA